jgi:hypothetical protein
MKFKDKNKAIKILQAKISRGKEEHTDYGLDTYRKSENLDINDSDDRDCCAYIDAAGPKFECNHYFSSIRLCGSCYSGGKFPEYEEIETILTKDEYEEIISFNIFIKALDYGITKGDNRYKAGIKLIDSIKHIYDKLKSDEAFAFFEDIQKSEMEYLTTVARIPSPL